MATSPRTPKLNDAPTPGVGRARAGLLALSLVCCCRLLASGTDGASSVASSCPSAVLWRSSPGDQCSPLWGEAWGSPRFHPLPSPCSQKLHPSNIPHLEPVGDSAHDPRNTRKRIAGEGCDLSRGDPSPRSRVLVRPLWLRDPRHEGSMDPVRSGARRLPLQDTLTQLPEPSPFASMDGTHERTEGEVAPASRADPHETNPIISTHHSLLNPLTNQPW